MSIGHTAHTQALYPETVWCTDVIELGIKRVKTKGFLYADRDST